MIDLSPALKALTENKVEFVIVGGIAITAYGSAYITKDLDFCYLRSAENLKRIVKALAQFNPKLRGFPKELPFFWDERTLQNGTNFTLETDLGDIDLLGEVAGVGDYKAVEKGSVEMEICDVPVKIISLDDLINAKRAAGRTKDLLVLPELEALREALSDEEE
ncbi:MAG: nucleotidyltransferase [Actinomycetota bacterium]